MPVRIRKANQHMAMFSVDADAAQRMIDYSGLQRLPLPARPGARGRLMLMHYIDGDLGPVLRVRHQRDGRTRPGRTRAGSRALQSAGAFIHHLPVDQAFTLEAGPNDLGLPESHGRLHRSRRAASSGSTCSVDGQLVDRHGIPAAACRSVGSPGAHAGAAQRTRTATASPARPPSSTRCDGVREPARRVRVRLGDHPYAQRARVAGPAEARAYCLEFGRQRANDIR